MDGTYTYFSDPERWVQSNGRGDHLISNTGSGLGWRFRKLNDKNCLFKSKIHIPSRGVSGGWAGLAIAHPDFGRIEGAAGRWRHATTRHITTCPPSVW